MIYVCIAARNHADSVGLLLWKVRRVFTAFPRDYQLLVVDDGSNDGTTEVLERYQRALPMTVIPNAQPRGAAAAVESLFREALARTDRPRRDAAILLPPDFSVSPDALPDLVKRLESGADVVVGERTAPDGSLVARALGRLSPWLLRPGIRVPGVRDLLSGCVAVRLATVKAVLKEREGRLLDGDELAARAELVARVASVARRISASALPASPVAPSSSRHSIGTALQLLRAGRRIRVRPFEPPAREPDADTGNREATTDTRSPAHGSAKAPAGAAP
jgi:glycosyltransferase involved in cell wall biosynthesis